jgi:hypothetical protein
MMSIQILHLSKAYKLIVENKDVNESIDDFNNILIGDITNASNLNELCEELITYLTEKTCINKTDKCGTCDDACENGHLNCLKYAHENGCTWNEYGHLDCFKYTHENDCTWDEYIYLDCSDYIIKEHNLHKYE